MKTQKTGLVNADSTRQANGLTPRLSPCPSILDLYDGEGNATVICDRQYLIGERQQVIVETEELDSPHVVLHEGVTGKFRLCHKSTYTGCHPAKGGILAQVEE